MGLLFGHLQRELCVSPLSAQLPAPVAEWQHAVTTFHSLHANLCAPLSLSLPCSCANCDVSQHG